MVLARQLKRCPSLLKTSKLTYFLPINLNEAICFKCLHVVFETIL